MTSLTRSAVFTFAVLGFSACVSEDGNGTIVTEQRSVKAFTKLKVEDGLRVSLTQGPRGVWLTTDENLRSFFQAEVRGDTLVLKRLSNFTLKPSGDVVFEVTNEVLEGLEVSGGAQVNADATPAGQWRLDVSGESVVSVSRMAAQKLKMEVTGNSQVDVSGSASDVKLKASGSSRVNTTSLSTVNLDVDASGGSVLNVAASNSATGSVSGNSRVTVVGNPQKRDINASGSSQVTYTDGNL